MNLDDPSLIVVIVDSQAGQPTENDRSEFVMDVLADETCLAAVEIELIIRRLIFMVTWR